MLELLEVFEECLREEARNCEAAMRTAFTTESENRMILVADSLYSLAAVCNKARSRLDGSDCVKPTDTVSATGAKTQ